MGGGEEERWVEEESKGGGVEGGYIPVQGKPDARRRPSGKHQTLLRLTAQPTHQTSKQPPTKHTLDQIVTFLILFLCNYTLRPPRCCNHAYIAFRGWMFKRHTERQPRVAYLLVLVLLQIARGHQAFRVDIGGDWLNELRVGVHVLHFEERQDVLDLQVVRAVGHGLPFGGQATRGHPVGVLFLLEDKVKC